MSCAAPSAPARTITEVIRGADTSSSVNSIRRSTVEPVRVVHLTASSGCGTAFPTKVTRTSGGPSRGGWIMGMSRPGATSRLPDSCPLKMLQKSIVVKVRSSCSESIDEIRSSSRSSRKSGSLILISRMKSRKNGWFRRLRSPRVYSPCELEHPGLRVVLVVVPEPLGVGPDVDVGDLLPVHERPEAARRVVDLRGREQGEVLAGRETRRETVGEQNPPHIVRDLDLVFHRPRVHLDELGVIHFYSELPRQDPVDREDLLEPADVLSVPRLVRRIVGGREPHRDPADRLAPDRAAPRSRQAN